MKNGWMNQSMESMNGKDGNWKKRNPVLGLNNVTILQIISSVEITTCKVLRINPVWISCKDGNYRLEKMKMKSFTFPLTRKMYFGICMYIIPINVFFRKTQSVGYFAVPLSRSKAAYLIPLWKLTLNPVTYLWSASPYPVPVYKSGWSHTVVIPGLFDAPS